MSFMTTYVCGLCRRSFESESLLHSHACPVAFTMAPGGFAMNSSPPDRITIDEISEMRELLRKWTAMLATCILVIESTDKSDALYKSATEQLQRMLVAFRAVGERP